MAEIRLAAGWVAAAAGAAITWGDAAMAFDGVSIDTRTIRRGELFVAIRGDRFDGAEFATTAIDAGAAGVLVPQGWTARFSSAKALAERTATRPVVMEAADTIVALQSLARAVRRESGAKVVAITGSAGKTTTKEVTSEFLATRYRVIRNRGNFNNHIGLPLSLIDLRQRPEIAVVELGMNHAGEISTLVRIAEPDVRVWTNVGEAHLGFFASVDAIAEAKAEIFEGAARDTILIANADDERIFSRLGRFSGRVVTFGIDRDADVRATHVVDRGIDGVSARVTTPRGAAVLTTPLVGRGNLANVLAATAIATEFDVPLAAIVERASQLRPSSHRGEVVRLPSGVTLIDDSYNANPTAMMLALDLLAACAASRRIAVLGEMLELGDRSEALHADVGREAARTRVDLLMSVGGTPAEALAEAAIDAGMARECVRHFPTSEDAAAAVLEAIRPGDLVLVKGSRGIKTDRIVERVKAERG